MVTVLVILATYIAIWLVVVVAWWAFKAERFGITGLPLYFVYRTTRLNSWIAKVSAYSRTAWRIIWNIGIVTGIGSMGFIFYQLIKNLLNLALQVPALLKFINLLVPDLLNFAAEPVQVQPIIPIPGVFVTFETFPYLVLALSVVVASHELSHGIASLADHVPLKSTGAFFAHALMGGFVEPDEEKLTQAKNVTKLRVFAAGSFTNVALGVLCIFLLFNFSATMAPFYNVVSSGVAVGSVPDPLPAHSAGVQAGDVVMSINGTKVMAITELRAYMARVQPGVTVILGTQRGSFTIKTMVDQTNSSRALIGISSLTDHILYIPKLPLLSSEFPPILLKAEFWLSIVLVSVGLINMLPMWPFDGDKFLETVLNALGIHRTRGIRIVAGLVSASVLILNIALSLHKFGFMRY